MSDQVNSKNRMFVVPVDIFDVKDLTIYEKMAYIVIQSHTSVRQSTAFPSYATIAREGSMSRPSAIKAVQGLVEKGLLKKEIRLTVTKDRKIRNTSNLYTVEMPDVVNDVTTPTPGKQGDHPSGKPHDHPSKCGDHPGHVVYPNNNHLTKPINKKDNLNKQSEPFVPLIEPYNWLEPDE